MNAPLNYWNLLIDESIDFVKNNYSDCITVKSIWLAVLFGTIVLIGHFISKATGHYPSIILDNFYINLVPIAMIGGICLFFTSNLVRNEKLKDYAKKTLRTGLTGSIVTIGGLIGFFIAGIFESNAYIMMLMAFCSMVMLLAVFEFIIFMSICNSKCYSKLPKNELVSIVGTTVSFFSVLYFAIIL